MDTTPMHNFYPAVLAVFSSLMLTACNSEVRYLAYSSLSHNVMLGSISPRYVASVPISVRQEAEEQIREALTTPSNWRGINAEPTNSLRSQSVIGAAPSNFMPNTVVPQALPQALPQPMPQPMPPYRFDYGFQGQCLMLCGGDEVTLSGSGVLLVNIDRQIVQLSDIHLTSADNNFNFTIDALTGRLDRAITADITGGELTQADLMRVARFDSTGNFEFYGYDPNTDGVTAENIIFEVQSSTPSGEALGFIFASGTVITN